MKLYDTSLPENYSRGLYDEHNFNLAANHTDKLADVVFSATATILNGVKSKDHPVAFRFEKSQNQFIAAAVAQYFPNEDSKKPGNWSLVFTFDEKDIPDGTVSYSITDPQIHSYFRAIAGDHWKFQFNSPEAIIVLPTYFMSQLYKWLDENAKSGEEVSIECEGIFQARVAIEGGEKVFALEPDGEIKMLIKDDASIEK